VVEEQPIDTNSWVEITTQAEAASLDGQLIEIDTTAVAAQWDIKHHDGQTRRACWDGHALRAGSHGPCLWATTRRFEGLRVRVVEESSTVGELEAMKQVAEPDALGVVSSEVARAIMRTFVNDQRDEPREPKTLFGNRISLAAFANPKALTGACELMATLGCERCCGIGILRGFTSPDRPCDAPGCSARKIAAKSEGPKEWTVVDRRVLLHEGVDASELDDGWSATYESVIVQKGEQRVSFMVADFSAGHGRELATAAVYLHADALDWSGCPTRAIRRWWDGGQPIHPVAVHGERCRDMVVDRLVYALRDGSVTP
jgi:hypothetical protein